MMGLGIEVFFSDGHPVIPKIFVGKKPFFPIVLLWSQLTIRLELFLASQFSSIDYVWPLMPIPH